MSDCANVQWRCSVCHMLSEHILLISRQKLKKILCWTIFIVHWTLPCSKVMWNRDRKILSSPVAGRLHESKHAPRHLIYKWGTDMFSFNVIKLLPFKRKNLCPYCMAAAHLWSPEAAWGGGAEVSHGRWNHWFPLIQALLGTLSARGANGTEAYPRQPGVRGGTAGGTTLSPKPLG